ncbi:hypothetical protein QLQ12_16755 [Actinoplanes sp. NEAU-A12]|uniref:Uncharacterized protein n=1 Tax=Actinoplanes sandaracinus TaxID=3045177 RepID=A0ABT6WKJ6_9ACTN|nr:hypothetical protein [Actinoplanes sandaracinus]MDI6100257.1 hypothetical protein [Actinoplanes sandaracinus]
MPETSAAPRLRPPRNRLDRRFVLWRTSQAAFWCAGVMGTLTAVFWFAEITRPWLGPVLLVAGAL